jgi:hypothetical protein
VGKIKLNKYIHLRKIPQPNGGALGGELNDKTLGNYENMPPYLTVVTI